MFWIYHSKLSYEKLYSFSGVLLQGVLCWRLERLETLIFTQPRNLFSHSIHPNPVPTTYLRDCIPRRSSNEIDRISLTESPWRSRPTQPFDAHKNARHKIYAEPDAGRSPRGNGRVRGQGPRDRRSHEHRHRRRQHAPARLLAVRESPSPRARRELPVRALNLDHTVRLVSPRCEPPVGTGYPI